MAARERKALVVQFKQADRDRGRTRRGFPHLDWERAPDGLAQIFGVESRPAETASIGGPPLGVWKQLLGAAKARASAYEWIYQCTRPHPMAPGRFLLEDVLIQRDPIGLLAMTMSSSGIYLRGWLMPLQGLVYGIGSDPITGSMMFAIFNGVGAPRVDVLDGLLLLPGADMGRSPSAMAMICERVAEVTGDQDADWKTFERLRRRNPLAPPGSIPEDIQRHLVRDFGPSHIADGDWLLSMTLARMLSRGPDWDSVGGPDPQA